MADSTKPPSIGAAVPGVGDRDGYRDDADLVVLEDTGGNRLGVIDTGER